MINKPSVEAMTNDEVNRYELVIATAKCARLITDEYVEQRAYAEKLVERKETDKPISALIDKDIRAASRGIPSRVRTAQYMCAVK